MPISTVLRRIAATTVAAAVLTVGGLTLDDTTAPAAPMTTKAAVTAAKKTSKCVTHADLRKVKVGMSITKAKKILAGKAVTWKKLTKAPMYSQHWPKACASTSAMLITTTGSKVTHIVNSPEKAKKTCATLKQTRKIRKNMTRAQVKKIYGSKMKYDYRDNGEWVAIPCQKWSMHWVYFNDRGRVSYVHANFYYG